MACSCWLWVQLLCLAVLVGDGAVDMGADWTPGVFVIGSVILRVSYYLVFLLMVVVIAFLFLFLPAHFRLRSSDPKKNEESWVFK